MPTTISPPAENILAHGNITTQNLVSAGIATAGSAVEMNCEGVGSVKIQVTGTYTGALTPQATIDGVTWLTIAYPGVLYRVDAGSPSTTIASAADNIYEASVAGFTKFRITALAAVTGTAVVTINGARGVITGVQAIQGAAFDGTTTTTLRLLVGGTVRTAAAAAVAVSSVVNLPITSGRQVIQKPFGPAETDWVYAAATGGITNTTTAVTIKAAGAANIRNYVTGLDIMAQALGAATEVAIRDGAGGAVLWRTYIGTGGQIMTHVNFPTPLKGTAATLLEVVTLTASVTGAVFFNAQGYQGG